MKNIKMATRINEIPKYLALKYKGEKSGYAFLLKVDEVGIIHSMYMFNNADCIKLNRDYEDKNTSFNDIMSGESSPVWIVTPFYDECSFLKEFLSDILAAKSDSI